jgi:hypothetical protein
MAGSIDLSVAMVRRVIKIKQIQKPHKKPYQIYTASMITRKAMP